MKFPRPSPSIFGLLQAIKNWRRRRPGNDCFYALWISLGAWSRVMVYYASAGFRVSGNISVTSHPTVHTLYCCSNEATSRQFVDSQVKAKREICISQKKKGEQWLSECMDTAITIIFHLACSQSQAFQKFIYPLTKILSDEYQPAPGFPFILTTCTYHLWVWWDIHSL